MTVHPLTKGLEHNILCLVIYAFIFIFCTHIDPLEVIWSSKAQGSAHTDLIAAGGTLLVIVFS